MCKRTIVIIATGGVPIGAPVDHVTEYMRTVLCFIGITDVSFVSATGIAADKDGALKVAKAQIAELS